MIEPLKRPPESARQIYLDCIAQARDRISLSRHADRVARCAEQFALAAQNTTLHELDQASFGPITADERKLLTSVYDNRVVGSPTSPGRKLYDRLITLTRLCPLCRVGRVRTIDHHLPKTLYPYLAAVPDNLVPACSDCNKLKGTASPTRHEDQTLHPFFDDISDQQWLAARVIEQTPPELVFHIQPPPFADPRLAARVRRHFDMFDLADTYQINAATILTEASGDLTTAFNADGAAAVHDQLERQAKDKSQRLGHNHWRTAAYRAMAESRWYCEGGFRLLIEPDLVNQAVG